MGDFEPIARARAEAAEAEETVGAIRHGHLTAMQAYATLAVAEALARTAAPRGAALPPAYLAELNQDAMVREAADRIDAVGKAGAAGPYVRAAAGLGLDYAKHWPTLVAVEAFQNALANAAKAQAAADNVTRGYL